MNKVFLIGRLTKNPELRYTVNNVAVCRFNLAVDRPKLKDKEQEADFINCVAYNKLAENITKYQSKGNQLAIIGRIQTSSYDAQDGTKRYTTDVVVNEVQFLDSKNDSQDSSQQSNTQSTIENNTQLNDEPFVQMGARVAMDEDYNQILEVDDSDLPF